MLTGCSIYDSQIAGSVNEIDNIGNIEEEVEEKENIAYDSPIEQVSTWLIENGSLVSDLSNKNITMNANEYDVILYKDNFYLVSGNNFEINFDIYADRELNVILRVDDGDGHSLLEEYFTINSESQNLSFNFTMEYADTWLGKIEFIITNSNGGNVHIDNFRLIPEEDVISGVAINQLGYLSNYHKRVAFSYNQGDYFNVYRENGEYVATYPIGNGYDDDESGEYNFQGDISDLEAGTYYIMTEIGTKSESIYIGDNIYDDVLADSLKFIFLQRCGMAIDEEYSTVFAHDKCHDEDALVYGFDNYLDVTGGWHDAGDYGRYVQTNAKVIADLLFAYYLNPEVFNDDLGITESGNNIPDILDEARYGLDWLMKLQKDDGSVYNKVTTQNFADTIMPDEDDELLYVLPAWSLTTASFAGVMAMASIVYEDIDSAFANECKERALQAGSYLKWQKDLVVINNPSDFHTGQYLDGDESDERLFAYISLYLISEDEEYLNLAKELYYNIPFIEPLEVANMSLYSIILILENDIDEELKKDTLENLETAAMQSANESITKTYHYPYGIYPWGSNAYVALDISLLMIAYRYIGHDIYKEAAIDELAYIFGLNAMDMSFVTGYGTNYPHNIHHRITMYKDEEISGALVGGVDQWFSEGNLAAYISEETANAKRYVDAEDSYSTNEVATYYNSSLVLALSFFD